MKNSYTEAAKKVSEVKKQYSRFPDLTSIIESYEVKLTELAKQNSQAANNQTAV